MRDRRILFWAALGACLVLAFRPLMSAPFALDDVGILHFWKTRGLPGLLTRCLLPHYFRPLAAPVYWVCFELAGPRPWGLRALMLVLHAAATALLFRLALRLTKDAGAAALAACLYGFSIVHWSGLSLTAGLPQYFCDALLWLAVVAYVERRAPSRALALALPLATAALLFKEHAVAFAALAPAARWARRKRVETKHLAALAVWLCAYAALRLAGPRSVLSPENHYRVGLAGWAWLSAFAWARPPAPEALAWAAATALGAGAALLGSRKAAPLWKGAALFGAAGVLAGAAPYAVFAGGLAPDSPSRLSLAVAAAAIGAAALAARGFGRARPAACGLLSGCAALRAIALFGAPDPRLPAFSRQERLLATSAGRRAVDEALARSPAARLVALDGFDPELRLPWLLAVYDPGRRFFPAGDAESPAPDLVVRGPR